MKCCVCEQLPFVIGAREYDQELELELITCLACALLLIVPDM